MFTIGAQHYTVARRQTHTLNTKIVGYFNSKEIQEGQVAIHKLDFNDDESSNERKYRFTTRPVSSNYY